jgi:stage II sporulation protein M
MQIGKVVSLHSIGITDFFRKNLISLIFLLFLGLGIIIGVLKFDSTDTLLSFFESYVNDFLSDRQEVTFGRILLSSFFSNLAVLFLFFLLGASLFGVITLPVAVILKGFLQGGTAAYLCSVYGLKGIAFNAVVLIPPALVFLCVMILSAKTALRFSVKISGLMLSHTLPQNLSNDFKEYCIRYLSYTAGVFLSALADAVVSFGLIKSFSLI